VNGQGSEQEHDMSEMYGWDDALKATKAWLDGGECRTYEVVAEMAAAVAQITNAFALMQDEPAAMCGHDVCMDRNVSCLYRHDPARVGPVGQVLAPHALKPPRGSGQAPPAERRAQCIASGTVHECPDPTGCAGCDPNAPEPADAAPQERA
jgi:hypothetical protein